MKLMIYTSTTADGSMKSSDGNHSTAQSNRIKFLQANDLNPADTTLHTLSYETGNFCRYIPLSVESKGDGILRDSTINADAVVVDRYSHAILLPLGDCVGAVIHDPTKNLLMVSHLGRHNLEQRGGTRCIQYLINNFGVNPNNLTAWLSPAAGRDNYPLEAFDGRGLQEVAMEQLLNAGIPPTNVTLSKIDTTIDQNYYSHSEFLKGNRADDGRFCIVAVIQPED